MRTRHFEEMLLEYGITELDTDDSDSRKEMLLNHPYPVIVEGEFMEFDTLNKWIEIHIRSGSTAWLFYGKTGYDFGFAEYFFADELLASAVVKAVPHIYTIYPSSYPPNHTGKSNGYNEFLEYDPADENAIVFKIDKD